MAAAANYLLSIVFVFRHKAKWSTIWEIGIYCIVVLIGAALDLIVTKLSVNLGSSPAIAKIIATALVFAVNFIGRRYIVFPLAGRGEWQERKQREWIRNRKDNDVTGPDVAAALTDPRRARQAKERS